MSKTAVLLALVMLLAGCRIASWASKVEAPPFGTVEVTIGGGVIGDPGTLQGTNSP